MQIQELYKTLKLQAEQKKDYVVSPSGILMSKGKILAKGTTGISYQPNDIFHEGLRSKLEIPVSYYKRMQAEKQDLLDTNVNAWLSTLPKEGMLLRTFETAEGNIARAFLSDRYNAIDNYDILLAALGAIKAAKINVNIEQCEITDRKMYVYITCPDVVVDAKEALKNYMRTGASIDSYGIVSGLCISNSEVGYGQYSINPRAKILRCSNGLMGSADNFRKVHLGAKLTEGAITWSNETKRKNMELIMGQTKDAIRQFLSEGYLTGMVQKLYAASTRELKHASDTVANVCTSLGRVINLSDEEEASILNHFITDGDPKASGVFGAVTRVAQNFDGDRRFDAEVFAASLLTDIGKFDKPTEKFSHS